eukprot:CAMPEP_0176120126 /NCGR_PEP_ID=MMETSP0120_2-20121206/60417_1 /TAXON_ID=160619 /ORGANISM="Kryptoperidinium foliaceum, Strain CCMP 1326" /LENGTH=46 /DNA_ID= /DNA_START= /DNA_END= /DNA_ORIENTATION=
MVAGGLLQAAALGLRATALSSSIGEHPNSCPQTRPAGVNIAIAGRP